MASSYFIKLNHFEGPLDLLLHLIKVNELDIFQVDLYDLTKQYLEYLRLIQFKDLKDAASFMEMAATLIAIKTKQILPDLEDASAQVEEEETSGQDVLDSLRQRLIDYHSIKEASNFLAKLHGSMDHTESNHEYKRLRIKYEDVMGPLCGEPVVLLLMYEQLLLGINEKRPVRVKATTESIGLDEVIKRLLDIVSKLDVLLLQNLYVKMNNRYELVAYILAMLQLVRDHELNVHQEEMYGPIWLYDADKQLEQIDFEGESMASPPIVDKTAVLNEISQYLDFEKEPPRDLI